MVIKSFVCFGFLIYKKKWKGIKWWVYKEIWYMENNIY